VKPGKNTVWRAGIGVGLLILAAGLAACGLTAAGAGNTQGVAEATTAAQTRAGAKLTALAEQVMNTPLPPATTASIETPEPARLERDPDASGGSTLASAVLAGAEIAPDFRLPDIDGEQWTLSQFHGKPVMLFYWATW